MKHLTLLIGFINLSLLLTAQPKSLVNKSDTILYLPYENGKAPFSIKGKMGIIDSAGKVIMPATFSRLSKLYDADTPFPYYTYEEKGEEGILDKNFNVIIPSGKYDDIDILIDGLFKVKKDGKYSFVNTAGICFTQWFDNVEFFRHGLAPVKSNGKWGFIDKNGQLIIDYKYSKVYVFAPNGLAAIKEKSHWGFIDTKGNTVIKPQYDDISFFWGNACAVKLYSKWGYIDRTNNVVIPFIYEEAESFMSDLALVKYDGKYGYINIKNEVIIPFKFKKASSFTESAANTMVKLNRKWIWINKKGECVSWCD